MKINNETCLALTQICDRFLDDKGILGYACAYNGRQLSNAALEYIKKREDIIMQYGQHVTDDNGNDTGSVVMSRGGEGEAALHEALDPLSKIEHEVDIMRVQPKDVIGRVSGRDALDLFWMIEGGGMYGSNDNEDSQSN